MWIKDHMGTWSYVYCAWCSAQNKIVLDVATQFKEAVCSTLSTLESHLESWFPTNKNILDQNLCFPVSLNWTVFDNLNSFFFQKQK